MTEQVQQFSVATEKKEVQRLIRRIYNTLSLAPLEYEGQEQLVDLRHLLRGGHFTPYCSLVRTTPKGRQRCAESDRKLIAAVAESGQPSFHRCHAGLFDFAFPVGRPKGLVSVINGQLLLEPLSPVQKKEVLQRVADLPIDEAAFKKALEEVPIIPFQTIKGLVALISTVLEGFPEGEALRMLGRLSGPTTPKDKKLRWLVHFLKENYRQRFSLSELAQKAGLSPSYLSHLFRKEFGLTVTEYQRHLRFSAAKEMLRNTRKPVTEIAFWLGWNDSNYFSLAFKKVTGLSPTAFRRSFSQNSGLYVTI